MIAGSGTHFFCDFFLDENGNACWAVRCLDQEVLQNDRGDVVWEVCDEFIRFGGRYGRGRCELQGILIYEGNFFL